MRRGERGEGGTDSATAPAGLARTVGRDSALGAGSSVHAGQMLCSSVYAAWGSKSWLVVSDDIVNLGYIYGLTG